MLDSLKTLWAQIGIRVICGQVLGKGLRLPTVDGGMILDVSQLHLNAMVSSIVVERTADQDEDPLANGLREIEEPKNTSASQIVSCRIN